MSDIKTALQDSPFCILQVTTRDNSKTILEAAEERSLFSDHNLCQKARSELINPRTRLAAEMAWMPGVSPKQAAILVSALVDDPLLVRSEGGLPTLARANLMAAALELVEHDEPVASIAEFIRSFGSVVESIIAADVMRDVNEDRAISGFPEVRSVDAIEDVLVDRRKTYRSALKSLLEKMDASKQIETMTDIVSVATTGGIDHAPAILDDLVDTYEFETQATLHGEHANIAALIESARSVAAKGEDAVAPILNRLETLVRNWDRVAQPIQLSAKSRGIVHQHSQEVAFELRSLAIDLNNEHRMLNQAGKMTELLREVFAELPDVAERLEDDAEAIMGLRLQAEENAENNKQWTRDITFRADVGVLFKEELSISPDGVGWKGRSYGLESITRVRWGGVRRSINGIPTGTDFTIAFGDNKSEQVISLRRETTYSGFIGALWRAVCIRLLIEMTGSLKQGRTLSFGDITVEDDAVTLIRRKFLGSNERVRLSWNEVHIWTADGSFAIGKQGDKKLYGAASYVDVANTHILEHLIRGAFKKGVRKLSDYLMD